MGEKEGLKGVEEGDSRLGDYIEWERVGMGREREGQKRNEIL